MSDARGGLGVFPAGKIAICADAVVAAVDGMTHDVARLTARIVLEAAAAWDSAQRLAAGPQPARERDTDAWWAD